MGSRDTETGGSPIAQGIAPEHMDARTGGDITTPSLVSSADGATPLTPTATPGSGHHVAQDVYVQGTVTIDTTGLATSAKQDAQTTALGSLATDAHLQSFASANHADLAALLMKLAAGLPAALGGGGGLKIDGSGTALPVIDQPLSLISAGNVNCTTAQPLSTETTASYLTVTNLDAGGATIYLGVSGVSGASNGEALPFNASRSWRSANPSLEYGIGSTSINVSVRR